MERRPWNRCPRCPFPVKQTGKLVGATYAETSKREAERELAGAPGQLAHAGPQRLASCHHQVLDQAGCVLQSHPGHCVNCGNL